MIENYLSDARRFIPVSGVSFGIKISDNSDGELQDSRMT